MKDVSKIPYFQNINMEYAYDPLTKVFNKEVIINYIKHLIDDNATFTVCICDLDNFKEINDSKGHQIGDMVLKTISQKLSDELNDYGVIGRFGGDEFIFVIENIVDYDSVWKINNKLCLTISGMTMPQWENVIDNNFTITVGVTRFPIDADDYDSLFENADRALYRGKNKGRNCFVIYNEALHANVKIKPSNKIFETEQLIDYIFTELSNPKKKFNLRYNDLLEFIAHYYTLDYITISDSERFYHINYKQGSNPAPKLIPVELFDEIGLNENTLVALNNRMHLEAASERLQDYFVEQDINASVIVKCTTKTKKYAYLRVDLLRERVWTREEKIVFMTLAKLYALYSEIDNK